MDIVLKRGPLDGQIADNIPDQCVLYRRRAFSPLARYRDTGNTDPHGYRIFEWWPPKPGEPAATPGGAEADGIHDAD